MNYRIELIDSWGRRLASYDEVPLFDVSRATADQSDAIRGILPGNVNDLSHAYGVRVFVDDELFAEGIVKRLYAVWSDVRKLILDQYVHFHEVIAIEAERAACAGNSNVAQAYVHREISVIVKDVINRALGRVHYRVEHAAYPDGAQREYAKFLARKNSDNELEIGGIAVGQWVNADRIDASGAYVKDGDTIAGLVVDGVSWPDLRMLMIDCEETSRNSHAVSRHPEVANWSDAEYDRSGYKVKGDAAKTTLEQLLDATGISYIELNPHRNAAGEFDDRVDAYGRYIGLVYGGGQCFNAAMVELGHADIYLYQDGRYHDPAMALKEFYSYLEPNHDSIETTDAVLSSYDVSGGVYEILTALAYAAGGYVWSVEPSLAVSFREAQRPDRVAYFNPLLHGITLGSDSSETSNIIYFEGHPVPFPFSKTYVRSASADEYGPKTRRFAYFPLRFAEDADKLVEGLLDDLAYADVLGSVEFHHGDARIRVGDILEVRGEPIRRFDRIVPGEWGERFTGRLAGRVSRVTHRFMGKQIQTTAELTSPLRSVQLPMTFMVRSQPAAKTLYQFRLDDGGVGLDMGYHLD